MALKGAEDMGIWEWHGRWDQPEGAVWSSLNAGIFWCPRTFTDGPHLAEGNTETGSIGLADWGESRESVLRDRDTSGSGSQSSVRAWTARAARTETVNDTRDICGFPASLVVKRQWRWPTQGKQCGEAACRTTSPWIFSLGGQYKSFVSSLVRISWSLFWSQEISQVIVIWNNVNALVGQ